MAFSGSQTTRLDPVHGGYTRLTGSFAGKAAATGGEVVVPILSSLLARDFMAIRNQALTVNFLAWNTNTNAGQTGDSANFTLRLVKDGGVAAAPTNAVSEPDSTNMPGTYELALTATEMDADFVTLHGISSTSNVVIFPLFLTTDSGDIASIYSDTTVIVSDTTAIHSDTTIIASDVVVLDAAVSDVESSLVIVKSDLVIVVSDTTAIHSDTTIIASDVVIVVSDTTAIHSDTTIIASDVVVLDAAVSDVESSLVIVKSDLVIVVSDTTAIHSDTTIIASDIVALNDISVADVLTTQMTESYAADGAAPTLAQALMMIQQMLGDFAISGTTLTVKQVDGTTTAATYTLDDGTTPTSLTRAS